MIKVLRICGFVFHNGHHWKNLHRHLFCCCGRHSSQWSRWQWGTRAWWCLQWLPFASPASSLEAPQPCKKCSWSKAQWEHCSKVHNQGPLQMLMEGELFLASLLHWWKYTRSLKVACNNLTATKTSKEKKNQNPRQDCQCLLVYICGFARIKCYGRKAWKHMSE